MCILISVVYINFCCIYQFLIYLLEINSCIIIDIIYNDLWTISNIFLNECITNVYYFNYVNNSKL